jgi:hypothetical protein
MFQYRVTILTKNWIDYANSYLGKNDNYVHVGLLVIAAKQGGTAKTQQKIIC